MTCCRSLVNYEILDDGDQHIFLHWFVPIDIQELPYENDHRRIDQPPMVEER
jgi:hypothetical protein